jgi:hypothetical protein
MSARIAALCAIVLLAALALSACTTSSPLLSEDERCSRWGGIWRSGSCRSDGGGGGM